MAKKISQAERDAFVKDLTDVCRKHGLTLTSYYYEYDEFDSDQGLAIERLADGHTPYEIEQAIIND